MSEKLKETRESLKTALTEYSSIKKDEKSDDEILQDEAAYAATGLKSEESNERCKAIEFLEILNENHYAQNHLLAALEDSEAVVVQKAIHALGKVATKKSIGPLKDFMNKTNSKHLVNEVAKVVSKLERIEE